MSGDIEMYEQIVERERRAVAERKAARAMRLVAVAGIALVAWVLGRFVALPDSVVIFLLVTAAVAGLIRMVWALARS